MMQSDPDIRKALEYFKNSQSEGLSPILKKDFLTKSISLFRDSLYSSQTNDQKASLFRNLAISNGRMTLLFPDKDIESIAFYHMESLKYLSSSWRYGKLEGRPQEWLTKIEELMLKCFDDFAASILNTGTLLDNSHRLRKLRSVLEDPLDSRIISLVHLKIAELILIETLSALEKNNFSESLRLVEISRFEISLAHKISSHPDIAAAIVALEEILVIRQFITESLILRFQAEHALKSLVYESEELNFDGAWKIVDMFKQATVLLRDLDIENEAATLQRLGHLFDKLLKIPTKAHFYYRSSFDLGSTLPNCRALKWFIEAEQFLQRYQQELVEEEEKKRNLEREPILEKLKPELAELAVAAIEWTALLKHIYLKHPPKNPEHKLDHAHLTVPLGKNVLQKAILHYHPDRQVGHGVEWKILCEEITKYLNLKYEFFK